MSFIAKILSNPTNFQIVSTVARVTTEYIVGGLF